MWPIDELLWCSGGWYAPFKWLPQYFGRLLRGCYGVLRGCYAVARKLL